MINFLKDMQLRIAIINNINFENNKNLQYIARLIL